MNDTTKIGFRDYQSQAIATIFYKFNIEPAGPENEQIVAACRSYRSRKDGDDGPAREALASRQDTVN